MSGWRPVSSVEVDGRGWSSATVGTMTTASKETIYKGTNLNPRHVESWDRLAARANMKHNTFIRFLFDNLTENDVDRLLDRL